MVEIKIDTTKASKDDIKRAIEFLKNYVDENSMTNNSSDLDVPAGAMSIFSQDEPVSSTSSSRVTPDSLLNDKSEPEEKADSDLDIKPIFY